MFILRKISPNSFGQENLLIGDFYRLSHFMYTPADFREALKEFNGQTEVDLSDNKVYGFIHYNNGHDLYPLYNGDQYYMMTENGNTFDNLTNKFFKSSPDDCQLPPGSAPIYTHSLEYMENYKKVNRNEN